MLARYASAAEAVAASAGVPYVDQLAPFIATIEAGRAAGMLDLETRLVPDAVHPDAAGGLIMAATILRALGETPHLTRIDLDAATGTAETDGCDVEVEGGAGPAFTLRVSDRTLPWPLPREALVAFSLPGSPAADLENHRLVVRGLPAGRYQLQVDGRDRVVRSAAELESGIDRGTLRSDDEQAARLLAAVEAKNHLVFHRWRRVQLFAIPPWLAGDDEAKRSVEAKRSAELARLDVGIAAAEAAIEPLRHAQPYRLTIAPAAPSRPVALTADSAPDGVVLAWRLPDTDAVASVVERATGTGVFAELARVPAPATTWRDPAPVDAARYRVRALGAKALSSPSLAAAPGAAPGFAAAYFRGKALAGAPAVERIDAEINMDWSAAESPLGASEFSVRWSAKLTPPSGAAMVLSVTSDDGVRVWLDGDLALDEWRDQAPARFTVDLPDRPVEVVIEYYQGAGGAVTRLEWSAAGTPRVVVPATAARPLFASAP